MKEELKKTVICPECKSKITLDNLGNHKEKYVQCTNSRCMQIFKNQYYSGGNDNERQSYVG